MSALALALLLSATPPRYGGELRVLAPATAVDAERVEPALARSPLERTLARTLCEPLYRLDESGALQPAQAELPEVDARNRTLTMRLRQGPVHGRDVTALLSALAVPGNPYRALTVPLSGPGMLRAEGELALALRFPYPDWARGLSDVGTCPLAAGHRAALPGAQSGPFSISQRLVAPAVRLPANESCPAGRPFAEKLSLRTASAKTAARTLAAGEAELVLFTGGEAHLEGPLAVATYFVVNPARNLSGLAALVSQGIDRAELVRTFVHGPAAPLNGLLAPSVDPQPAAAIAPAPSLTQARMNIAAELLVDGTGEGRAVAERLQVKLHDLGVSLRVLAVPRREFEQRLGAGEFDAALVGLPALPDAGLALAQVLLLVMPLEAVQQELAAIGAIADPAGRRERARSRARELLPSLPVVPLYAQALGVGVGVGVRGFRFEAAGTVDLGALWLESPEPRAPSPGTR